MVKQSSNCVSVSKQEERSDSYSSSSSPTTSSSSSSKFKGVRKRKWGKFVSEIRLPNSRERIWLGSYDTAEKAARAFDAALFCLRGRSAKFNFPNNPPEIDGGRSLSPSEIQEAAAKFANSDQETTTRINSRHSDRLESPSPSVSVLSDETTVQLLSDNEFMTMDGSFLDLMMDAGSGNVSDYGIFPGFDDFSSDFLAQPPPPPCNFDYGEENFDGVVNFAQESFLWNF